MRCLYEVLGLSSDADDSQIKKGYRQAALQWHPDKNHHRQAEAEERFKEIQNAYEILSDKHERAWYDNHRDQILRAGGNYQAGGGNSSGETAGPPEDLSLYQYFSSSCYEGFTDSPKGFYTVYREVFDRVAEQESQAAENEGNPLRSTGSGFGTSSSAWQEVSAFYQRWLHFVSEQDFAWADVHNLASAPNRKVRRLMEDDNKKRRKAARREFQDNVRSLVAFVRKRDRRVIAWQQEQEQLQQQRRAEEERRREEERLQRMRRAQEYQEAEWLRQQQRHDSGSDQEVDSAVDELYCVACDKFFKTANAMANHERSKKHLERAEALRAVLQEEEEYTEDADGGEGGADSPAAQSQAHAGTALSVAPLEGEEAAEPGVLAQEPLDREGSSSVKDDFVVVSAERADSNSQNAGPTEIADKRDADGAAEKCSNSESFDSSERDEDHDSKEDGDESSGELDEDEMLARMLRAHAQVKNGSPRSREKPLRREAHQADADQHGSAASVASAAAGGDQHASAGRDDAAQDGDWVPIRADEAIADQDSAAEESPSMAAKQSAPAKIAAGSKAGKPRSKKDRRKAKEAEAMQNGLLCTVCREQFETRNQLFKHIKDCGHAQLK